VFSKCMAKAKDPDKLSLAEELAIQEYIKNGGDQSKAYRKAFPHSKKWKQKTIWNRASELFNRRVVIGRLSEVEQKAMRATEVTKEYVLRTIVETIELCSQTKPVVDRDGEPIYTEGPDGELVPAYVIFNPMAVLKGAEMLAKHKGLYELDNRQKTPITKHFEKLSLETQSLIVEKLREVAERESELDEESEATPNSRTTH